MRPNECAGSNLGRWSGPHFTQWLTERVVFVRGSDSAALQLWDVCCGSTLAVGLMSPQSQNHPQSSGWKQRWGPFSYVTFIFVPPLR